MKKEAQRLSDAQCRSEKEKNNSTQKCFSESEKLATMERWRKTALCCDVWALENSPPNPK